MTHHDMPLDRRLRFAEAIGDAIAVIPAGAEQTRNDDVHHPFRQNSDFFFLTGFEEPDAVAVIDPSAPAEQFVLFVRPRDREQEIWNGYRAGVDGAKERHGADAAYPVSEFDAELRRRLVGRARVVLPFAQHEFRSRVAGLVAGVAGLAERFGRTVPTELVDAMPALSELRLRKTEAELAQLRVACQLSGEGHAEAMRFTQPGRTEAQVQAAMEYVWRAQGSSREGYGSIVAAGRHACVLHYTENDGVIGDGDLVLIDAAAEYGYFSSDITRTFPANGRFTGPQRAVYDVVLAAQRASLERCRVGGTVRDIHQASVDTLTAGMIDLGLLPGTADEAVRMHLYREYFMHGTSHWLGLDVHDAGAYGVDGKPRPLEAGMTFTVEPGLYVDPDRETVELTMFEYDIDEWLERRMTLGVAKAKELEEQERASAPKVTHPVPAELRGIGVRIEDDIAVTEHGYENMSADVPTDPDAVEALCSESPHIPYFPSR
jgi:Xaa-Pro aminopeptidase